MHINLYLASASPRRHALLNQIGIQHTVCLVPSPPGEDEPKLAKESPLEYVQRTAQVKASLAIEWLSSNRHAYFRDDQQTVVLTADTTVAIGNTVLGKPRDSNEVREFLRKLSGTSHSVMTAVVLSKAPQKNTEGWEQWRTLSTSTVQFSYISDQQIEDYLLTGEPFGKAGAYGIQGHAAKFISHIEGSYSGIMGLPLYETNALIVNLQRQTPSGKA